MVKMNKEPIFIFEWNGSYWLIHGKEVGINLFSNDRKKEKQFEYDENNIGKIWKCLFLSFYVNVNGIFKERYIKIMNEKYP